MVLDSDATVTDDGAVVGDPTEAALVVLAAKLAVDAEETRRAYPRLAEVPFDSEYKFMATFHRADLAGQDRVIQLVKGGPDVVLARCTRAGGPLSDAHAPIADALTEIDAANARMGGEGLRVLAFAARFVDDGELDLMTSDPMSLTQDLDFVGMVGIIDPLRSEAKAAVQTALGAGIDVRMITGDHAVTAEAIGKELGLGPGAISGSELQALSDEELAARLPELHVFGRVSPEDKLRLARVMQEQGLIVAMTGDAVNDAAALKQADIGVAMGSGSEVTKQAGRMILTDDNFGTLVNAVQIGRRVYDKIVSYVRYQMTQLLALVVLFVAATIFDLNEGVALTPLMVLYLLVFVTASGVVIIALDPGDPDVMHRPPRRPQAADHQPHRRDPVGRLRRGAGGRGFRAARVGPRPTQHDPCERVAHHDLRRHGPRNRVQRGDQPARPVERAHAADPHGLRGGAHPDRADLPGDPAAEPAGRHAHPSPDRTTVAGRARTRAHAPDRDRGRQAAPTPTLTTDRDPRRAASRHADASQPVTGRHRRRRLILGAQALVASFGTG